MKPKALIKLKAILVLACLMALPIHASTTQLDSNPPLEVEKVLRVYDGDTFYVDLRKVHPIIGNNIGIRISNIDTPEKRGSKCQKEKDLALEATQYVTDWVSKAKSILIINPQRGKYFRIVGDVLIDGERWSTRMLELGYAHPYTGGTKSNHWCETN